MVNKKWYAFGISLFLSASVGCSTNFPLNNSQILQNNNVYGVYNTNTYYNIELKWNNKSELVELEKNKFDLYGMKLSTKTIRARVNEKQINYLKSIGTKFEYIRETDATTSGLLPGYRTYQQMKDWILQLSKQYPDIVTIQDIGDTVLKIKGTSPNNDIWQVIISNKSNKSPKPTSLFIAGLHPRELAPVEMLLKLINELVGKYGKDQYITNLVDTREIHIVPMVNVDGRIMVENGNSWQRENANGVDLNRDFECKYLPNLPPDRMLFNIKANSIQPETKAIQDLYKVQKINLFMDVHSYGEMFFWPVGYSTKDIPEVAAFKNVYTNSFKKINYEGGTSAQILYPTVGTSDDYAYIIHHTFGLGMEVGKSFRPNYQDVEKMWQQLYPHYLYLIKISDNPYNQ